MPLKHVHKVTVKGRVYYYAWRGGPRLKGAPGSPEFMASYYEANQIGKPQFAPYTIGALVQAFKASPEYRGWSANNRRTNAHYFDLIMDEFGEMRLADFDTPKARRIVIEWRDEMSATPTKADHAVKHLRRILSWAQDRGQIGLNVASKVKKLAVSDHSQVIWEPEEFAALLRHASPALSFALRLAALTGLARVDLAGLRWTDVGPHSIQTQRQKTKALAIIPLLPETQTLLAEIPRKSEYVLTTVSGIPWSAVRLGQMASRAAAAAGVKKRLHDLRGTAATYFLSQQLSYAEVALILGWSERDVEKIARRYVHRERFAQSIVERLANKTRPVGVKPT